MKRIFVAGARGMVGSALCEVLGRTGECELLTPSRDELDLLDQAAVRAFVAGERPDAIYLAAAKVGGIHANDTYPADFLQQNLALQVNVIEAAHRADVPELLFLGSSCIYPREAAQPMSETALLSGPLEPTNEPYAIAKIAGIKLCDAYHRQFGRDYRSVMPTNLYGQGDNFHPDNSHVIPGLMRRFRLAIEQDAPEVVIWGSGKPRREFLHVTDMAEASVFVMGLPEARFREALPPGCGHVNIGTGTDCSIGELARSLARVSGYEGALAFDASKPDGAPRKLLDCSRIHAMGWRHRIALEEGLAQTWRWFLERDLATRRTS